MAPRLVRRRAIAEVKQRSQRSAAWVTQNFLSGAHACFQSQSQYSLFSLDMLTYTYEFRI
jgi:hypothetical protein